ncbi:universal stress protein [Roseovarius sp. S4756]|uniref:universal stress protein n=1 Tax=Roseovarius maritimus TaxID=3342637 RepID=UPI003727A5E4
MKNASVLMLVGGSAKGVDLDPVLETAAADETHVSVLVLEAQHRPQVYTDGVGFYGMPLMSKTWQKDIEKAKADLSDNAKRLEKRISDAGVNCDVDILGCDQAALPSIIGRHASTFDAVIISNDLRDQEITFGSAVHGVLFQSSTAVILNPGASRRALRPARAFISWDTSIPAARAVHAALPMLTAAEEVTVGIFDPVESVDRFGENPGSDVARWLSHHGCHVTVQSYPSGGHEIGKCIHTRSTEIGADLVVMGAFGHSRLRQAVFGGTTRSVVDQTEFPVLLAH